MTPHIQTSVTILGGSIVGLSTAVFLAAQNVPFVLIERHKGSSPHPRAIGWTHRTMELFRSVGLEHAITAQSAAKNGKPRRVKTQTLSGEWFEETHWGGQSKTDTSARGPPPKIDFSSLTPVRDTAVSQDKLEPILRARVQELAGNGLGELRLGCTMTSWSHDADGVTLHATDAAGEAFTVRSAYLVACDGARSRVREDLGIPTQGVGYLRTLRSVLFRCPPIEHYLARGIHQWSIANDEVGEAFMVTYSDGRWALMTNLTEEQTGSVLSEAEQKALIRAAIGDTAVFDDDITILAHGQWDLRGSVATSFSYPLPSGTTTNTTTTSSTTNISTTPTTTIHSGPRIFLAGDAAHALPPNRGGYGANTGIADAHNLAWKLAAVVHGLSSPALMHTYSAERHPIARVRHDQIFVRGDYAGYVKGSVWEREMLERTGGEGVGLLGDVEIEFGQGYRSSAVLGSGSEEGEGEGAGEVLAKTPEEWKGAPGTRAPHVVLQGGSEGGEGLVSTLDLFSKEWVVLAEDDGWRGVVGVKGCRFVRVGQDVREAKEGEFREKFGLGTDGAVLVRPDGYIAARWKAMPGGAADVFRRAYHQVAHTLDI